MVVQSFVGELWLEVLKQVLGGGGGRMGLQVFVEKLGHGSAGFRGGFVGWLVVRVPWRTC
jgi:hypothetical protein